MPGPRSMIVWLNGALVAAASARIDPADRGFTLGDGLFETIAVAGGEARHLADHLARLRSGASLLGIPMLPDPRIALALGDVLRANRLALGSARITLTRGPAPRGLRPPPDVTPTMLMTVSPPTPVPEAARAVITRLVCRNPASPLARIKSIGYLEAILALRDAERQGGDEALLLDPRGNLAGATASNLFLMQEGRLCTPRLEDGALAGLRRQRLIERCGAAELSMPPDRLGTVGCVFLANSLRLRPVASVDGRLLPRDDCRIEELTRETA